MERSGSMRRRSSTSSEPFHWRPTILRRTITLPELNLATRLNACDLNSRNLLMQIYQEQRNWPMLRAVAEETLHLVPGDSAASAYLVTSNSGASNFPANYGATPNAGLT